MGHTLVTRLIHEDLLYISGVVASTGIQTNKISFGRNCDRETANRVLPYHFTVCHWSKEYDETYLERLRGFKNPGPCSLKITGTSIMCPAAEGSALLYFAFEPDQMYERCVSDIRHALLKPTSSFHHITSAVSKDHDEIEILKQRIDRAVSYPFIVHVEGFDLYHIWRPVRRVGRY